MHLTGLRLRNITCFEDVELRFMQEGKDRPSQWIVLLGENGTGKSTILQMLGLVLIGPNGLSAVGGGIDWRGYVRESEEKSGGEINIKFRLDSHDSPGKLIRDQTHRIVLGENVPFSLITGSYVEFGSPYNFGNLDGSVDSGKTRFPHELYSLDPRNGWFASGYAPWRRKGKGNFSETGVFPSLPESSRAYRFATLFGDESALTSASDWIANLYFRSIHPIHTSDDLSRFEIAVTAISKALPGVTFDSVTPDREVLFVEAGTRVSLDRLSDGFRSTLAWVVDLIRRLSDAFPENPLEASGVVLIDEIDLHLHPRWQREVVERTRRLFPNLQFIVSTHSPFVAQDMREGDTLIVLKRQEPDSKGTPQPVRVEQGQGFANGWRADQILTSYLFGLEGTRNQSVLNDESEYERLLDAEASGNLTATQRRRLEALRQRLESVLSSPGETPSAQAVYKAADAVIEALSGIRVPDAEAVADLPDDDSDLFLNPAVSEKT